MKGRISALHRDLENHAASILTTCVAFPSRFSRSIEIAVNTLNKRSAGAIAVVSVERMQRCECAARRDPKDSSGAKTRSALGGRAVEIAVARQNESGVWTIAIDPVEIVNHGKRDVRGCR